MVGVADPTCGYRVSRVYMEGGRQRKQSKTRVACSIVALSWVPAYERSAAGTQGGAGNSQSSFVVRVLVFQLPNGLCVNYWRQISR